jgi:hypothetical protein
MSNDQSFEFMLKHILSPPYIPRYGQQDITLYNFSSILALMPLEKKRYKIQSV